MDEASGEFGGGEGFELEEVNGGGGSVFLPLKANCLELLELLQNPKKHSPAIPSLLHLLRISPPHFLQPFFDYALFPLLLLYDAAVNCRSAREVDSQEKHALFGNAKTSPYVSDNVAEGVLQCLEELLKKCRIGSVDQMVVVLKKLTYGVLLSPSEAAEEFREGVIRCFRALLLSLYPCSDETCLCKRNCSLSTVSKNTDLQTTIINPPPGECLLAFLQSQSGLAAVGHWLSLLLKAADTEVARGHRGSAKLRIEAFITLRVLIARVGSADALAFFLPGVVSQFAKVLHVSKTMISGAAGSMEALDQAIRGLAEYLTIVLQDDENLSSLDISTSAVNSSDSNKTKSTHSYLEELRRLPIKTQGQSKILLGDSGNEAVDMVASEFKSKDGGDTNSEKGVGSFHVNRTKDWIESTSAHVNKLLSTTFPHICVHPSKKVRQGLLSAIQGMLLKCRYTLKECRLMLMECLFVLVVDDAEDVSVSAQEFLENLFLLSGKHVECDVAEIFVRLIEKLPKVVLESEESLALSHTQKLLAVIYYSGPQLLVDYLLQSPIKAAQFLDIFSLCLSQNSVFAGSLDKLILARPSSTGYLHSVTELKDGRKSLAITNAAQSGVKERPPAEDVPKNYELPRMPPWFAYVGSPKLYEALAGILRLVGLSLMADCRSEGHLSIVADIPLGYLRKLVSEIRMKEYNKESWQSWYNSTGSGQLLRQASTAACILNEIIFGLSEQAKDIFKKRLKKSRVNKEVVQEHDAESVWKVSEHMGAKSQIIECVGHILHEYLSPELWGLPVENKSSLLQTDGEAEDITLYFFQDIAMLHQVIIDGIGVFNICLGKDFASSGFLHSSLYMLLENLICSNFQVRSASDSVLHVLAATSGYATVGHLVVENADYIIDSICRQLRHLDLNPHVPDVLAAMLSYVGVAHKILKLLEEPMRSVSVELEILGRHQHPDLTIPFLKSVAEIAKAAKLEACSLPAAASSYSEKVKSKLSYLEKKAKTKSGEEEVESILFEFNDSKRYRRTVGSIVGSCLTAATPLLASLKQPSCLVSLEIIEDAIVALAKVEEAYRHEKETKESIEELIQLCSFYHIQDTLDADEGVDENRFLPAVNKIWPFLVICIRNNNNNPAVARRCLSAVSNTVQICGGDFFARRFHNDGAHFWKLLTSSPFHKKPFSKQERTPLQLPYRNTSISTEDTVAEASSLKVQAAVLNMIADLSRKKKSASALELVLKKVSGLVVGIACSGVVGLRDASVKALQGLASIDPDLIWLLLADVYYSKKKDLPPPPTSDFPVLSQVLPPPPSPKDYLYVQYAGQTYGFDVDFSSVEAVFKTLHSQV